MSTRGPAFEKHANCSLGEQTKSSLMQPFILIDRRANTRAFAVLRQRDIIMMLTALVPQLSQAITSQWYLVASAASIVGQNQTTPLAARRELKSSTVASASETSSRPRCVRAIAAPISSLRRPMPIAEPHVELASRC
jgi:hypothetical protein